MNNISIKRDFDKMKQRRYLAMLIESIIGFLIVGFVLLAMSRKLAVLILPRIAKKTGGNNKTFLVKTLVWLSNPHRWFGITALLLALLHGGLIFARTGSVSVSGIVLIAVITLQAVSGYLLENKIGKRAFIVPIHKATPFLMIAAVIIHIIVNGVGY